MCAERDAEMGVASHRRGRRGKEAAGRVGGPFCPTLLPAGDQRVEPITGFLPAALLRSDPRGSLSRPHHTTTTSVMVTLFLLAAPLYIHKLARGHRSNRSGLSGNPLFPPLPMDLGKVVEINRKNSKLRQNPFPKHPRSPFSLAD